MSKEYSFIGVKCRIRANGRLADVTNREEYSSIQKRRAAYSKVSAEKERVYERQTRQESRASEQFARTMDDFFYGERRKESANLVRVREGRRDFIVSKLEEKGYAEELRDLQKWRPHYLEDFVNKNSVAITPRAWSSMEQDLEEYIEELIKLRKKEVALIVFGQRYRKLRDILRGSPGLAQMAEEPYWSELAVKEPLRTMLLTDLDHTAPKDSFSTLEDTDIVAIAQQCLAERYNYLRGLLPKRIKTKDDAFYLATTYFKCSKCEDPIPYPCLATHYCLHATERYDKENDTVISIETLLYSLGAPLPFYHHSDKVVYDEEASRHAALLTAFWKDSKRFTFAHLESLNARFECLACEPGKHRQARRWRSALLHSLNMHCATDIEPMSAHWALIEDTDALERIYAAELKSIGNDQPVQCKHHTKGCTAKILGKAGEYSLHRVLAHGHVYAVGSGNVTIENYPAFVRF